MSEKTVQQMVQWLHFTCEMSDFDIALALRCTPFAVQSWRRGIVLKPRKYHRAKLAEFYQSQRKRRSGASEAA